MSLVEGQETLSPTVRAVARRFVFWAALVTAALIIAVIAGSASRAIRVNGTLDAESPSPEGAKAVVEVLRAHGVKVTVTGSLDQTFDAIDDPASTTLFVFDRDTILTGDQMNEAMDAADTIVSVQPTISTLERVNPSIAHAGGVEGKRTAHCDLPAARAAQSIEASGSGFRILDDADGADDAVGCFRGPKSVYSLVQSTRDGEPKVTFLGAQGVLSNEQIIARGNAALALNLLGENENLVWYIPTVADLGADKTPTLGELSPDWVVPAALTILAGVLAAAVWRGRRFGPLIVENLPVVVRASETMQGRSRLYQANSARLHALDSLRIGTVSRLATICGLPRAATVDAVVLSAARLTGRDIQAVRHLLVDAQPHSDAELVRYSDQLLELEREAKAASKPL